jgi:hypothetical protein
MLLPVLAGTAWASFPEDVDLPSMIDFDGEGVFDQELLAGSYRQLVAELGTLVANKPNTPAATLGLYGFDVDLSAQFVLTEARYRAGEPSPWQRAAIDETAPPYHVLPTLTVRKGLPLSSEIGASFGWISGTSTGTFGGFGRIGLLEGYRPLPDVSVRIGYSGYVGNEQLDVSTLDLGVTVGSTFEVGRFAGLNQAKISPFANLSSLRVTANPTIDPELERTIGAVRFAGRVPFGSTDVVEDPLTTLLFGGGLQIVSGTSHLRVAAMWAPQTIPTVTAGFGFTY